ncbi:PREDICTED: transcription elongation factor SPT5-like [Fragaria vesca subsp. vesca]
MNPGVLQFFEHSAAEADGSDDSDMDDFMEEELEAEPIVQSEPGKARNLPFIPKEEEVDGEEFERMMEERYRTGSTYVTYAEDNYENKRSIDGIVLEPSAKDPVVWKVKCAVGRERHSAFCMMQKFVDLASMGTKLQIISAFAVDHIKGFIFIEADKLCDVQEACKGLCNIFLSRVTPVPKSEAPNLLAPRTKNSEIAVGTWARVKSGNYKGDLGQVVAVNEKKKATVKLIPRIDLQAMAMKFGGGVSRKKLPTPAPRLISTSELEEFRPLIQHRKDKDTGLHFLCFDGLLLKDGYLYKKVPLDSLICRGVVPSDEEILKFRPSENNESTDLEWLSQLYGENKKRKSVDIDIGDGKGEGSSKGESSSGCGENLYGMYDLVCFGKKDFGLVLGIEKDDTYKILKEGSEGSAVVTIPQKEIKNVLSDVKFTAYDQRQKPIGVNDTVQVLEGPLKDRQGIVKQVYRGTIFMFDENETENGGYFCSKSHMCEKIKLSIDVSPEKDGDSGAMDFDDFTLSPKSPLSPKKPWLKENNFNQGNTDGMFSIGQTLRIRVGPLKGYLCRVLAIRRADITVKLDSQQRVLTVKAEHLTEVRAKSSAMLSEDPESSSLKPFDLLGTEGGSTDWTDGAGTSAGGDAWNAGGSSGERNAWPSFSASGNSLQPESSSANPFDSDGNGANKGTFSSPSFKKAMPLIRKLTLV